MAAIQQSKSEVKGRSAHRTGLHMDMTPMVDLAFLLLTFFVMTSVLTDPQVLKLEMPERETDGHQPIPASRVLNIILGENDKIYWYQGSDPLLKQSSFSYGGIRNLLLEKKSQIQKMHVLIKPLDGSTYKNMVDILDEILITEVERYSIVKVEDADKQLIAEAAVR